jgi:hypothetical protein
MTEVQIKEGTEFRQRHFERRKKMENRIYSEHDRNE